MMKSKFPRSISTASLLTTSSSYNNINYTSQSNTNDFFKLLYNSRLKLKFVFKYLLSLFLVIFIFELGYYYKKCPTQIKASKTSLLNFINVNSTNESFNIQHKSTKKISNYKLLTELESNQSYVNEKLKEEHVQRQITQFNNVFSQFKHVHSTFYLYLNTSVQYCPAEPPYLQGALDLNVVFKNNSLPALIEFYENINTKNISSSLKLKKATTTTTKTLTVNNEATMLNNNLSMLNDSVYGSGVVLGGSSKPFTCLSRYHLAVIIPYRNRFVHLAVLLRHLHFILQRQLISYRIFVTEQYGNISMPFNKGRIMNAAFIEALKLDPKFDCFVFHDVDLIPEDDRNIYSCPPSPRHMSVAIDKFKYKLPYSYLIGGVFILRKEHFIQMNGYSNSYWGWGAEDDDMYERLRSNKLKLNRPPIQFAKYRMIKHEESKLNPERHKMLKTAIKRYKNDGVNNVKYKLVKTTTYMGFTHFEFDIGEK